MFKRYFTYILIAVSSAVLTLGLSGQLSWEGSNPQSKEVIQSIPYAASIEVGDDAPDSGVSKHIRGATYPGLNLFTPRSPQVAGRSETLLMDMDGNIVHRWKAPWNTVGGWEYAKLAEGGDLIVYSTDRYLMKVDWEGRLKWKLSGRYHHDINFDESGNILVLARDEEIIQYKGKELPILNDIVVRVSPDGKIIEQTKLFSSFEKLIPEKLWINLLHWAEKADIILRIKQRENNLTPIVEEGSPGDILHTNNISLLPRNVPSLGKKGDWLVSCRSLDMVAVLDSESHTVTWSWGPGQIIMQHHPVVLDNGNLLIFDNGVIKNFSRSIELNPESKEVLWEFNRFFSRWGGSNQRLPNGNTLIMVDNVGRAIEVNKQGEIVWEYHAHMVGKKGSPLVHRSTVYRMERLLEPGSFEPLRALFEKSLKGQKQFSPAYPKD